MSKEIKRIEGIIFVEGTSMEELAVNLTEQESGPSDSDEPFSDGDTYEIITEIDDNGDTVFSVAPTAG